MTDFGAGAGQYVTYREHIATKEEAQKRQAALEMEVATLRAALMHVPEDLRKLTDAVQALGSKLSAPAQPDHMALQVMRLIEAMERDRNKPTPAQELVQVLKSRPTGLPWLLTGGAGVLAALLGWQVFIGG